MSRANHIHMAKVFISQARHFRRHGNFHATLLGWAANRRKEAQQIQPMQGVLFA